jgi:hypothetical protein
MEQIKVEIPNKMKFQMPTYGSGNNEEYHLHVMPFCNWSSRREQLLK